MYISDIDQSGCYMGSFTFVWSGKEYIKIIFY